MASIRRRLSPGRALDWVLDWFEDHDGVRHLTALALAAAIGVGAVVASRSFVDPGTEDIRRRALPDGPAADQSGAEVVLPSPVELIDGVAYVNTAGGYSFVFPETWEATEDGEDTEVVSENGHIVLTLGPGPPGALEEASVRLLESIQETVRGQRLIGQTRDLIDGSPSLIVSGTATDPAGESIRFLAITVGTDAGNYSITVSVPARSDPVEVLPRLQEIVASFQVLEPEAAIFI